MPEGWSWMVFLFVLSRKQEPLENNEDIKLLFLALTPDLVNAWCWSFSSCQMKEKGSRGQMCWPGWCRGLASRFAVGLWTRQRAAGRGTPEESHMRVTVRSVSGRMDCDQSQDPCWNWEAISLGSGAMQDKPLTGGIVLRTVVELESFSHRECWNFCSIFKQKRWCVTGVTLLLVVTVERDK